MGWLLRRESNPISNRTMKVETYDKVYQSTRGKVKFQKLIRRKYLYKYKVPFSFANVCILANIKLQVSLY